MFSSMRIVLLKISEYLKDNLHDLYFQSYLANTLIFKVEFLRLYNILKGVALF